MDVPVEETYAAWTLKDGMKRDYKMAVVSDRDMQCAGTVTSFPSGTRVDLAYVDVRDPVIIGAVTVILIGAAAFLCSLSIVVGLIAKWKCREVEVTDGFSFNPETRRFVLGCKVRCADGDRQVAAFAPLEVTPLIQDAAGVQFECAVPLTVEVAARQYAVAGRRPVSGSSSTFTANDDLGNPSSTLFFQLEIGTLCFD